MQIERYSSLLLVLTLAAGVRAGAPVARAAQRLEPSKPIEREIAGGEAHTYQLELAAGQFVRIVVEQKGIDLTLALAAPNDGKQVAEVNLTRVDLESLSYEATVSGDYRFTIRALGAATSAGTQTAHAANSGSSPSCWATSARASSRSAN